MSVNPEIFPDPVCAEHIRLVFLDWDGVCSDSLPAGFAGTANVLRRGGSDYRLTFEEYLREFDHPTRHTFFEERGVVATDELLTEWFLEEFRRNPIQLFPDFAEGVAALLRFKDPGVELMILSSNADRASIMGPLKANSLAISFQAVFHGVHDKAAKIRDVLHQQDIHPSEAAIVGDFESDMIAGHQAALGIRVGMSRHPILGARLHACPSTSRVVDGFADLPFALFS